MFKWCRKTKEWVKDHGEDIKSWAIIGVSGVVTWIGCEAIYKTGLSHGFTGTIGEVAEIDSNVAGEAIRNIKNKGKR